MQEKKTDDEKIIEIGTLSLDGGDLFYDRKDHIR